MLQKKIIFLMMMGISTVSMAQKEDELDLGLDPVYTETLDAESDAALNNQTANEQTLPRAKKKPSASNQPIYILNQSNPTALNNNSAQQVQKQATTVIEDSPVIDSRAEKMRKARQQSEVHTEQKIVEKLENSRLEDEKRRADVLFGDRFDKLNQQNQNVQQSQTVEVQTVPQQQIVPQVPPKVVIAPAITEVPHEEIVTKEPLKNKKIMSPDDQKTYITGLLGMTEFPKAANVQGQLTTGFAVGVEYKSHLLMDLGFIYAQFQKKYPTVADIEQYTLIGNFKYQILEDVIKPFVGGAISYNYRTFNEIYFPQYDVATSYTFDAGLSAGALFEPFEDFGIGLEYRYMWNLSNKTNGFYPNFYANGQPIDELNYYVLSLIGRFTF
jgi:hypothetical protein